MDEPAYGDVLGSCLGGIPHNVYYCLTKKIGVDGYCKRFGDVDMPLYVGIHTRGAGDEVKEMELERGGVLYLRGLGIASGGGGGGGWGGASGLDAVTVGGGMDGWRGKIGLGGSG